MDTVSPQHDPLPHPDPLPIPQTPLANAIAIVALALLTSSTFSEIRNYEHGVDRTVSLILLGVTVAAWLTWVLVRGRIGWATAPVLIILSLAGGALAAFAPTAIIFTAVATLGAATAWRIQVAIAIGAGGWVAVVLAVWGADKAWAIALGAVAAIGAGALVGFTRRQVVERTHQAAQIEVETARAEVERTRAELLGERNHLAREIHDVLAHTLAALSLQLEAFATVVDGEPETSPAVRAQLEKTQLLVREGLNEARGAVQALRDDAAPLDDQLRRLAARHQAEFTVSGPLGPLSPPVVMSLYRVAQEALTNVMKHAPGTATSLRLAFGIEQVTLRVDNLAPPRVDNLTPPSVDNLTPVLPDRPGEANSTSNGSGRTPKASGANLERSNGAAGAAPNGTGFLAVSGAGYGLRGIAERVALLGGHVDAGPTAEGWRVEAVVPLASAVEAETVQA
jgi:signal transduction histidine kinase